MPRLRDSIGDDVAGSLSNQLLRLCEQLWIVRYRGRALRLFTWRCLKAPHCDYARRLPLRVQPVFQDRVPAPELFSRSSRSSTCAFHTPAL
jgi:hypothetical protein